VQYHIMPLFGRDGLGMKLNTLQLERPVPKPHDEPILALGTDLEAFRKRFALHHQRMVAGGPKRAWEPGKNTAAFVTDGGDFAMLGSRSPDHFAAKDLPDRLMPQTDSQDGDPIRKFPDDRKADSRRVGVAGSRRDHDPAGREPSDTAQVDRVVAPDHA